jgi:predicted  nucleic acid-binding Zn-ribbon protein
VRKYILIPIIVVCVYGCGNGGLEERIKGLENENKDLGLKLQKQGTGLESTTGVINDVTALLKNIQETEIKIERKELKLRNTIEMESTVDMREEMLDSIQGLYDDLKRYREEAVKLQEELDSLMARNTKQNETIATLTAALEEETIKVGDMSNKIGNLNKHITHMKSELNIKEKEIASKEMEIKSLHQEINSIFYVIGNSRELISKKIIVKKGIPLLRSLNPFSKNYVLGEDFTLAEFTHERSILNKFSVDGRIKKILPYRNRSHYDITYENGLSFVDIKDSKNFWHQKYLVIVTW